MEQPQTQTVMLSSSQTRLSSVWQRTRLGRWWERRFLRYYKCFERIGWFLENTVLLVVARG